MPVLTIQSVAVPQAARHLNLRRPAAVVALPGSGSSFSLVMSGAEKHGSIGAGQDQQLDAVPTVRVAARLASAVADSAVRLPAAARRYRDPRVDGHGPYGSGGPMHLGRSYK